MSKSPLMAFLLIACSGADDASDTETLRCAPAQDPTAIDAANASEATQAPSSLEGIGSHNGLFGTGADPNTVTLGTTTWKPDSPAYEGKDSMEFEVGENQDALAPLAMKFVGFANRNAATRDYGDDRGSDSPFDDLELCFESESTDWPGMILCYYHLSTSSLLSYGSGSCTQQESWGEKDQRQGRILVYPDDKIWPATGNAEDCAPQLDRSIARGEKIGESGSVGDHHFFSVRFKVRADEVNSQTECGDTSLHVVQPGNFFYWKCFEEGETYEPGVLTYPFDCSTVTLDSE